MNGKLDRYIDRQVPRYTSYPTAPHFHSGVTASDYRAWLDALPADTTYSLYFHVPFCASMCWYCGCHTRVVNQYDPVNRYAQSLRDEIRMVAQRLGERPAVTGLHFGGGTPTMLSGNDFAAIVADTRQVFEISQDADFAVEMDPRTVDQKLVDSLARAGVNRASLGVQDFDPTVQKTINRVQPFEMTAEVVSILQSANIDRINFDLMYGLPHQDIGRVVDSVDRAVSLAPNRIALFGYAHVPWMKRHQKLIPEDALPDGPARRDQFAAAAERLADNGYVRIGLDHFARPDDSLARAYVNGSLRRNFQGYTVDPADALLGFGASSIGSLPQGYVQNEANIATYQKTIAAGDLPIVRGFELSRDDHVRRDVIERLMCDGKIDLSDWIARHHLPEDYFEDSLDSLTPLATDGLISLSGGRIAVADEGQDLVRIVCAAFDSYLSTGTARHSRAV